jgi:hypothetical protein
VPREIVLRRCVAPGLSVQIATRPFKTSQRAMEQALFRSILPCTEDASPGGMTNSLPQPKQMRRRAKSIAALLAAGLIGGGCAVDARPIPVDPGLTFAVHTVHGGLVVDRVQNGETGVLQSEGGWSSLTNPEFSLHLDGAGGERRLVGIGPVVVHRGTTDEGPVSGRVEPSWDDQAIRLTLRPVTGPPLVSDVFSRIDTIAGMDEITRLDQTSLDLRGSYQALLRDPSGRAVGFLRVDVSPWSSVMAACEGVLPPTVGQGMAVAAAETLGAEIDWIGRHVRGVSRPPEWR